MNTQMNLSVLSLDKGQDFGLYGSGMNSKGELFDWMIGCDGHGSDQIIHILKSLDWNVVMSKDDSLQEVVNSIRAYGRQYRSTGSTYLEAKIFADRIETCSVGDSKLMVFMDEKLVYENTEHNLFNEKEQERLRSKFEEKKISLLPVHNIPNILTPTDATTQTKHYYTFENGDMIAMSQSLGHNETTGIDPERNVIPYTSKNKVRIILMSDGLFDMISSNPIYYEQDIHSLIHRSSSELASLGEQRWKQVWHYYEKKDSVSFEPFSFTTTNSSRSGYDDVLVLTCDIEPTEKEVIIEPIEEKEVPICAFKNMISFVVHIFEYSDKFKICLTTKEITMCYISQPLQKEEVLHFWSQFIDENNFIESTYFQSTFSPADLDIV